MKGSCWTTCSPPTPRNSRLVCGRSTTSQRAHTELGMRDALQWRPVEQDFDAPGTRLRSLSDSRVTMHGPTKAVEDLISSAFQHRLHGHAVNAV